MIAFRVITGQYACTCQIGRHDPNATIQARRKWGCEQSATNPVFQDPLTGAWESKKWDLHRCPAGQTEDAWNYVISVWSAYGGQDDRGPLPVAGGWMDQTLWFTEVDSVLRSERARYLEVKRAKSGQDGKESKAKRGR